LHRYKISIKVTDGTSVAIFTLLAQQAEQMVGYPASQIIDEEGSDEDDLPEKIRAILIKIQSIDLNLTSLYNELNRS
jgi:hypothetical protein